jgi:hypothetical protein
MTKNNKQKRAGEEQEYAVKVHDKFRDELLKRQLSNTENYDKTILTLSSSGLALSLTFLKFLIPSEGAEYIWLIVTSWICFLISIIISLIAYYVSNLAISKQLIISHDYYINQNDNAFEEKNNASSWNKTLNNFVGISFVIAMIILVIFVTINLNQKEPTMTDKNKTIQIDESAVAPVMQKILPQDGSSEQHSAEIPTMEKLPNTPTQPKEFDK